VRQKERKEKEVLGKKIKKKTFAHTPPKTMKMTVTAGPIAIAASALGAAAPTASPIAVDVSASRDSTPQNLAKRSGDGLSPADG